MQLHEIQGSRPSWLLKNARIVRPNGIEEGGLLIQDGYIESISPITNDDRPVVDAEGLLCMPAFIDVHTHGAVHVDVNKADPEGLQRIAEFFASQACGTFLASILTDEEETTKKAILSVLHFMELQKEGKAGGARLLGIHLEGPFLSPEFKGAMPEYLLQQGNLPLLKSYLDLADGAVRYITLAPEVPGVSDLIPYLRSRGVTVAMGHSGATYEETLRAVRLGAEATTHCCNAMKLLHQHHPMIFGATLEAPVYAEIIADGRHLHKGTVRTLLNSKGKERIVAITDSIMAAGLPDGEYTLGVNAVTVKDGDAKLTSDGTRAGSTLTMLQAFRNLKLFTGLPYEDLALLLSQNAARLLHYDHALGSLEREKEADFCLFTKDLELVACVVSGKPVYVRD